jgi:multidrug efflux system outer membrane protein
MRRLALVLSSTLLTACAVGPDFTKPDATTPEAFRMAEAGGNTASIANTPWWELLKDQELQKLIRTAFEENKDLQRAAAAVEEFQARLFIAKTDFAPADECYVECAAVRSKDQFLVSPASPIPSTITCKEICPGDRHLGTHSSIQRGCAW